MIFDSYSATHSGFVRRPALRRRNGSGSLCEHSHVCCAVGLPGRLLVHSLIFASGFFNFSDYNFVRDDKDLHNPFSRSVFLIRGGPSSSKFLYKKVEKDKSVLEKVKFKINWYSKPIVDIEITKRHKDVDNFEIKRDQRKERGTKSKEPKK